MSYIPFAEALPLSLTLEMTPGKDGTNFPLDRILGSDEMDYAVKKVINF